MHLSMAIAFARPLAANLNNAAVSPLSWSVSDGRHTFQDIAKNAIVPMQATLTTDSTGKIIARPVNAHYCQSNGISVLYTTHATNEGDHADDYACAGNGDVSSNFVARAWTVPNQQTSR
jgi:hypothetical protein